MSKQTRKTPYVTVSLTATARTAVQSAAVAHTSAAGHRVTVSAVILAALAVAERHPDELIQALSVQGRKVKY